ncbi:uncharacterized protein [Salminus brasiliensis]|uniref:uncharacterized protein isoform X1 n=2 Tax=Salminus brasiliensis TaxID=930266 RepID=UPI003B82DB95
MDSNVFVRATAEGAELSSNKRRKSYIERAYPVVMPFQYVIEHGHAAVYVPILPMIQELFKHTDAFDKIQEARCSQPSHYMSHRDGSYIHANELLSASPELKLPLILYVDELEVSNPLGTSRKIHKLLSVYWVLADLPSKYRSALHVIQLALLCKVVAVNSGKRSRNNPESESPHCNIKRPRRAEVNYLPNFPRGEDASSLERLRVQVVEEVSKMDKNLQMIERLMQTTYALRRKQIIADNPSQSVKDLLENWPALRIESQVCAEFHRITNINLRSKFYAELDKHTPRLLAVYWQKAARTGKTAEALRSIFSAYDLLEQCDVNHRRTAALRALPVFLCEDDSAFFRTWNTEKESEPDIADLAVGLLTMVNEDPSSPVQFSPARIAIVLEGDIVLNDLSYLADAFLMLLGLMYALNICYPKKLIHTFHFIQKVIMGLDDFKPLTPRLLNLKNDLLGRV